MGGSQLLRQAARNLPPVADGRASQAPQPFGQCVVGTAATGQKRADSARPEQLERSFPEVIGGVMPFLRRLGVVCPAIKLGQRQRQPRYELVVEMAFAEHGAHSVSLNRIEFGREARVRTDDTLRPLHNACHFFWT